jgi:cytochrome subunit of sulfide dehydrogenase
MATRGIAAVFAVSIACISTAALTAPPTPAVLSNACGGCHGTNGASAGLSVPSLAGQSKEAIVDAMNGYKSGTRPATVMGRLAKGYTSDEILAMGDFFSRQNPYRPDQVLDGDKVRHGQILHAKNCKRCHSENGKQGTDESPVLAGQWLEYLQIQMEDYRSGKRKMSDKMAEKMKSLSQMDLDALSHFYASVK